MKNYGLRDLIIFVASVVTAVLLAMMLFWHPQIEWKIDQTDILHETGHAYTAPVIVPGQLKPIFGRSIIWLGR